MLVIPQPSQHSESVPPGPPGHVIVPVHVHITATPHDSNVPHMLAGHMLHELLEDPDEDPLVPEPLFEPVALLLDVDVDPLLDPEPLVRTHNAPTH